MTCQDYLDRLLAGLSDDAEARTVEEHERSCARCRERGTSMRAALSGIASLPAGTPPGFARGAMQRVASARAPWEKAKPTLAERLAAWLTPRLIPVACSVAACLLIAVGLTRLSGSRHAGGAVEVARVIDSSGAVSVKEAGGGVTLAVPDKGYARLAMGQVADATFAGAAEARVTGTSLVQIDSGSVTLHVDHKHVGPEGFRVVTPHLTVFVTGTQFTVRVTRDESIVELFAGRVDVKPATTTLAALTMQPNERVRGTATTLETVTRARPAWPLPPTAAPSAPDEPVRASRPPLALSAQPASARVEPPADRVRPPRDGEPVKGTALPGVSSNANVHEPFREPGR